MGKTIIKVALSARVINASVLPPSVTDALVTYYDALVHGPKFGYAKLAIEAQMRGDGQWPDFETPDAQVWGESIIKAVEKKTRYYSQPESERNPAQAKRARLQREKASTRSAAMTKEENAVVRLLCQAKGTTTSTTEGKRIRRAYRNGGVDAVAALFATV